MKVLSKLKINGTELTSIQKLKEKILEEFPGAEFILYGSKAKGNDEEFSDIDILVLLGREVTTEIEKRIFDIAYDIGLENDIIFSIIVESKKFWESPLAKAMPFHWNVTMDGITI